MIEHLSPVGYEQTKSKLANRQRRLNTLELRDDLTSAHKAATRRSYHQMMSQYRVEMELYAVEHSMPASS